MSTEGPVSLWIEGLRNADEIAADKLWRHYVRRLLLVARAKLRPDTRKVYDEQDAAVSAFNSLCVGITEGRFPDLNDRESLWSLLLTITSRKVSNRHRYDGQEKRDTSRTLTESVFVVGSTSDHELMAQLPSREPSPEHAAAFAETSEALFERLGDETLVQIAAMKVDGYTDDEVAKKLSCSRRTAQRRLKMIRIIWSRTP
jgi:DNA-directed RNA polymerase specialized sigma24 family protein